MEEKKDYLKLIKETKGQAIEKIPASQKTSLICKMAVEYDKELVRYIPNKYLPEILQGEEFINELAKRAENFIRGEARLLSAIWGKKFDEKNSLKRI